VQLPFISLIPVLHSAIFSVTLGQLLHAARKKRTKEFLEAVNFDAQTSTPTLWPVAHCHVGPRTLKQIGIGKIATQRPRSCRGRTEPVDSPWLAGRNQSYPAKILLFARMSANANFDASGRQLLPRPLQQGQQTKFNSDLLMAPFLLAPQNPF